MEGEVEAKGEGKGKKRGRVAEQWVDVVDVR